MNGNSDKFEFMGPWMSNVKSAKDRTLKFVFLTFRHFGHRPFPEQCRACEYASILQSLENTVSYPWVKEKLMSGDLALTGWFFDFEQG